MNDDATLLRQYAEEAQQAAFTELVHRHINLVYGAALRRTGGDRHRAHDVAQQVFIALAREARKLTRHTVLAAWLHTATRNAALNLMTAEKRREARELAAESLAPAAPETPLDWEQLRPVIDTAIDELPESDRAAVVLRFLDQRPFAEIGAVLRVSEDAARMRTERALDKLRAALARRGITSTAAAVGAIVAAQPIAAAPAGLAASIASHSLATLAAGTAAAATLTATAMILKLATTATLTAVAAFGAGAYFGFSRNLDNTPTVPIETPQHSKTIAALRQENQSLRTQVDQLNASLTAARAETQKAQTAARASALTTAPAISSTELARASRQKAIMNNLRQLAAALDQFKLENSRWPSSLDEIVGATKYIKALNKVAGESYDNVTLTGGALTVVDAEGVVVTYDPNAPRPAPQPKTPEMVRFEQAYARIKPSVDQAAQAYTRANGGKGPPSAEALIPYFTTPQDGADFVELIEQAKAANIKTGP